MGDNIWRSQNPTAPAQRCLGTSGIHTCGNQLLATNPPTFTLKPNTRKQKRTKGKMASCAMSECWWEGHSLGITETTENQIAFTGDKTNTVQEDRAPLLHTGTSEGDSKGRNRKASFSKSQEMCSRGGVSVSAPHSQFIPHDLSPLWSGGSRELCSKL